MRGGRRSAVVVLVAAIAAVSSAGCGGDDSAELVREQRRREAGEKLKIKGIPDGGNVEGNVAELKLSGAGVKLVEPDGDTSGRTGHYVVFVDRQPVPVGGKIPEDRDVLESEKSTVEVTGLTAGRHQVSVVMADGARRRMGEHVAEAALNVKAPTLRATTTDVEAKKPVVVDVKVEGVGIVEPDGNTSGGTGHFAVFVDREPTAAGAPVPAERGIVSTAQQQIVLEGLTGGEHEVWVVLVNGAGVPFDPLVADKVVVEVG